MTGTVVAGWSAVTAAGIGISAVATRVAEAARVPAHAGVALDGFCEEPLPVATGQLLAGFDVRAELGRKGTSFYDRTTALSVVCARDALCEAGIEVERGSATRIGVALGTSLGSFRSTSDFSRETLVQEKPYLVNPVLFPNSVMNGAAGQVAIRFGLRGVNATIAGGQLAFLNALRYACGAIDRGYADVMLTGAVEEFSPHRAWAHHLVDPTSPVPTGEAAGLFVLAGPQAPDGLREGPRARILSVALGYGPGGGGDDSAADAALTGCIRRALRSADIDAVDVVTVLTGEHAEHDVSEYRSVLTALGHSPLRLLTKPLFGECDAASGAVALGALLASGRSGIALMTARGQDGAVGAAIVEGAPDGSDSRR